jgi:hypothetical protein
MNTWLDFHEAGQTQPFLDWWRDLNAALVRTGSEDANQGEARRWYKHGTSPEISSALLKEQRRDDAP